MVLRKHHMIGMAFLVGALAPVFHVAAQERGEIIGDSMYVYCQYRVAAQFPSAPMTRDITYRVGNRSAPARQFYIERGMDLLSVTVAHFADGPEQDQQLIASATEVLNRRGEVKFDFPVWYDEPNIRGRQVNIALSGGRALRGSVYMADHRLYITEAVSDPNDVTAFLFEQSVSLIDENGADRDGNPANLATTGVGTSAGLPPRQYDCSRNR